MCRDLITQNLNIYICVCMYVCMTDAKDGEAGTGIPRQPTKRHAGFSEQDHHFERPHPFLAVRLNA